MSSSTLLKSGTPACCEPCCLSAEEEVLLLPLLRYINDGDCALAWAESAWAESASVGEVDEGWSVGNTGEDGGLLSAYVIPALVKAPPLALVTAAAAAGVVEVEVALVAVPPLAYTTPALPAAAVAEVEEGKNVVDDDEEEEETEGATKTRPSVEEPCEGAIDDEVGIIAVCITVLYAGSQRDKYACLHSLSSHAATCHRLLSLLTTQSSCGVRKEHMRRRSSGGRWLEVQGDLSEEEKTSTPPSPPAAVGDNSAVVFDVGFNNAVVDVDAGSADAEADFDADADVYVRACGALAGEEVKKEEDDDDEDDEEEEEDDEEEDDDEEDAEERSATCGAETTSLFPRGEDEETVDVVDAVVAIAADDDAGAGGGGGGGNDECTPACTSTLCHQE